MKQFYSHYENWEDYKNGMYCIETKPNELELINNAIVMLSNVFLFNDTCKEILINWPIAVKVNLTNKQCNRKAWLGQSACNYKFNTPEILTRQAWSRLTDLQRYEADNVALKIIKNFELKHENKNTQLHF